MSLLNTMIRVLGSAKPKPCTCGKGNTTCQCIMKHYGKKTPAHPYMRIEQE